MTRLTQVQIEAALEHGVDIPGRRIFLHGDVDESSIGLAIRGLYLLAGNGQAPIDLFITSYGGEIDEAFALHDVTRTIRVPVHTVALGKCQSAAPLLVACGHPGQRWASENCEFLLHSCYTDGLEGTPAQIEAQVKAIQARSNRIDRLLSGYTNQPYRHWKRLSDRRVDTVFTAEQALEWGLIDNIWSEKD